MGLNFNGRRLNDNVPLADRHKPKLEDKPIEADEFRRPPTITAEPDHRWYCIVTVPQGEYRCSDGLSDIGIASYVPTSTQWVERRKGNEKQRVQTQTPLFRSYCFARLSTARLEYENGVPKQLVLGSDWTPIMERDAFRKSPIGVLGVMTNNGVPSPMPLRDAAHGRQGLADFAEDERAGWFDDQRRPALVAGRNAKPKPVVMKGEEVRLTGGPFASFHGIAENDNDKSGVKVSVNIFGRSTPVFVPISDLENLTRPDSKLRVDLRRA